MTLNFHPDRMDKGVPILRLLAEEGVYRSQFETGTSNGGLTAHPGGDRWHWESRMFGGAYDGVAPHERPKYGALNHTGRKTGGAPRFGSAHLRLKPDVARRCSFCYPDSVFAPGHFGVIDRMEQTRHALRQAMADPLDDYIEAHVHGPLCIATDVEALVLDPCYRESELATWAASLPCAIEWHEGFRLEAGSLLRHADYRGREAAELGARIAAGGVLDPARIGRAVRDGAADPTLLKKVWHCLARYGDVSAMPG